MGAVTFVQERAALQVLKLLPLKLGFLDRLSPEQVFLMVSHFWKSIVVDVCILLRKFQDFFVWI